MSQTDPTFYRSPAEAIAAPAERLAYVAAPATRGRIPSTAGQAESSCSPSVAPTATTAPAGSPCWITTPLTCSGRGSRIAATSSSRMTAGGI